MSRNSKRVFWIFLWLALASALWALNIEATYEHNVRRGIPADFRSPHKHAIYNWRA
jgi:hypothetical protein